jgi:hypothetical protein
MRYSPTTAPDGLFIHPSHEKGRFILGQLRPDDNSLRQIVAMQAIIRTVDPEDVAVITNTETPVEEVALAIGKYLVPEPAGGGYYTIGEDAKLTSMCVGATCQLTKVMNERMTLFRGSGMIQEVQPVLAWSPTGQN